MTRAKITHGFRYDPAKFIKGHKATLDGEINAALAKQTADGALSDHPLHAVTQTGGEILRLIEMGASPQMPQIKRAVRYVLKHKGKDKGDEEVGLETARALRAVGAADDSAVRKALRRRIDQAEEWIHLHCGCPWTPVRQLKGVWAARQLDDRADATIARGLRGIAEKLNPAGCADFNDPWGYLDLAAAVDHPLGRAIVLKQIAMILRSQRADGGWGPHSVTVFRALQRYGLLEPLRKARPLPPDWRVVRSIPAPSGELLTMTWGDGRLWVLDRKTNQALAVSPTDGAVQRRVKLPGSDVRGIGWWDGCLAVTQQDPRQEVWKSNAEARRLYRIDPADGTIKTQTPLHRMHQVWAVTQVGEKLVVADGFLNTVGIFDAADPTRHRLCTLGAPGTICLAAQDGSVWHTDWLLTGILFRSDLQGRLLEWGTVPFEGGGDQWDDQMSVTGLAWDGKRLWALDRRRKRICVLQRLPRPRTNPNR